MSEYMKITNSPANLVGSATVISADGATLGSDLTGLVGAIERLETDAVIGTDDFAKGFVKSYRQDVPVANGTAWATDATKQSATSVAQAAVQLGDAVGAAIQDYLVTDGQGEADIGSIEV